MSRPWDRLISGAEVRELHEESLFRYGGAPGTPDSNCIESALGNAWTAEQYSTPEDGIEGLCFAAYVFYYLIRSHCFVDGNKRTAWATMVRVLARLGLTIDVNTDDAESFCIEIITDSDRHPTYVAVWLAERLASID